MPPENGDNGNGNGEEIAAEIAEVVEDVIDEELAEETGGDTDVEIEVIEAPEIPETAAVDVGDLHISGPPALVESITKQYLKDHIDHNPHDTDHGDGRYVGGLTEYVDEAGAAVTPGPVEDAIQEGAAADIADAPPGPSDWLFRERGGQ